MLLLITPHIAQNWGDTAHEIVVRCSNLGGDTAQNSRTEGGTPHKRIEQMKKTGGDTAQVLRVGGRVGGWPGGRVVYQSNNATLWLHLASWNLPDSQLS